MRAIQTWTLFNTFSKWICPKNLKCAERYSTTLKKIFWTKSDLGIAHIISLLFIKFNIHLIGSPYQFQYFFLVLSFWWFPSSPSLLSGLTIGLCVVVVVGAKMGSHETGSLLVYTSKLSPLLAKKFLRYQFVVSSFLLLAKSLNFYYEEIYKRKVYTKKHWQRHSGPRHWLLWLIQRH